MIYFREKLGLYKKLQVKGQKERLASTKGRREGIRRGGHRQIGGMRVDVI